jgi:hypothetical protein
MKVGVFLSGLVVFWSLTAGTSYAQYHPATTQAVAKHPPVRSPSSPASRRGSVGGPANKTGGISGPGSRAGGINGTVRPKY